MYMLECCQMSENDETGEEGSEEVLLMPLPATQECD